MLARHGYELFGGGLGPIDVADQLVQDADAGKRVRKGERVCDFAASQLGLTRKPEGLVEADRAIHE